MWPALTGFARRRSNPASRVVCATLLHRQCFLQHLRGVSDQGADEQESDNQNEQLLLEIPAALVELACNGSVDSPTLITKVTRLKSVIDAYRAFDTRQPGWLKVVLIPGAAE